MAKTRPRRLQARYPRDQLPAVRAKDLQGPWTTRADRARTLLTFCSQDRDRQQAVEEFLARVAARQLSEDRVCEAFCLGLLARLREQQRSEMVGVRQESAAQVRRIRRDLPPLLEALDLIADEPEPRALAATLARTWMTHAPWIDVSRGRCGGPPPAIPCRACSGHPRATRRGRGQGSRGADTRTAARGTPGRPYAARLSLPPPEATFSSQKVASLTSDAQPHVPSPCIHNPRRGCSMETLLETGSVSRRLDLSAEWVRFLADSGQLPPCAITDRGRRLFRPADVEALRVLREQRAREDRE